MIKALRHRWLLWTSPSYRHAYAARQAMDALAACAAAERRSAERRWSR